MKCRCDKEAEYRVMFVYDFAMNGDKKETIANREMLDLCSKCIYKDVKEALKDKSRLLTKFVILGIHKKEE